MTDEARKCPGGCDETYTVEEWENESAWSEILEDDVCIGCYQSDQENRSTVLVFAPDGDHGCVLLGDLNVLAGNLDSQYDGEIPHWLTELFDGPVKRAYTRTDGWRGYYDTPAGMTGIKKIADGWITSDWGDAMSDRKATARALGEWLATSEEYPPKPLYWILEPTSNVFSTASEIFTKEGDYDEVVAWLAEQGYTVAALEESLG